MTDSAPASVLILQHVGSEPPGTIAEALDDGGISHRTVKIHRGDPVPDTRDAHPRLSREIDLIDQAVRDGLPLLGVCLGSQLLAHVLGADI